jgi:hypothetical protein
MSKDKIVEHHREAAEHHELADSTIAAGSVSTQASAMLRIVDHCRPEPFAAIVPATPGRQHVGGR